MKLLVCGSRDWTDRDTIADTLADYAAERDGVVVIHGDARGADRNAAFVAGIMGFEVRAFPADWSRHGRRAGILRNLVMLEQRPDKVLAFWDGESRGTAHMIATATKAGVPVEIVPRVRSRSRSARGRVVMPERHISLSDAIETMARGLMAARCPFEGASGDFDCCSSLTREVYEQEAAEAFGLTLDEYYDLAEPGEETR